MMFVKRNIMLKDIIYIEYDVDIEKYVSNLVMLIINK